MKQKTYKIFLYPTVLVLAVMLSACTFHSRIESRVASDFEQKSADFVAPAPQRWQMENGLTILLQHDDELPLVNATLYIPGGAYFQSPNQLGLADSMGTMMRAGGAGELSPDELDLELERLAAGIGSSFGGELGEVSFSSLSNDVDQVFSLFTDVLLKPRFDAEKLQIWKGQSIDSIRRRNDDPQTMAFIAYTQVLYGDSIYGKVKLEPDIKKITRSDLIKMHKFLVRPNDAILAVAGDISMEKIKQLASKHLAGWKARGSARPSFPPVNHEAKPGVYFIKTNHTQSTVYMGHLGVPRHTKDQYAIEAFNDVFGGQGFGVSRLFKHVRTELGLAYSVYGAARSGIARGRNFVVLQTKADATAKAVRACFNVLGNLQNKLVDPKEFKELLRIVENSYVFKFETAASIVNRRALLSTRGYADDYDSTYLQNRRAVTPDQIKTVANRRWDLSKFVIVIVGNQRAYESMLAFMSDSRKGDLSDPSSISSQIATWIENGAQLKLVNFDKKLYL